MIKLEGFFGADDPCGGGAAIEGLIREHYGSIYAYCCRHTGDPELAKDLTQDTFVRLLASWPRYQHRGKLLNYLYVIVGNLCRDHFKKKRPLLAPLPPGGREPPAPAADPARTTELRSAILSLPFNEREAFLLRYYQDLPLREIARITHATVATVSRRLRRAQQALYSCLKEEEPHV